MFSLALSSARHQWRTLLGSGVALACGIGLLAATLLVIVSAQPRPSARYADADLMVVTEEMGQTYNATPVRRPLDDVDETELVTRLQNVAGVASVIPDRVFPAQLADGDRILTPTDRDDPLGHNMSSSMLGTERIAAGLPPAGAGQVVAPESSGLQPGDAATLLTAAGRVPVTVSGVADGRSIYLDDVTAASMSSGVTAVGVVLHDGVDPASVRHDLAAAVGDTGEVLTGADLVRTESSADRGARNIGSQLLGTMGLLAAMITVFIVATTFAFTVTQRRRELGLLRAVGATPRQVRRMLLAEALAVGAVSSVAGAGLGCAVAPVLGGWMRGADMLPRGWELSITVLPVLVSVATGVGVALSGVWLASRRAATVQPIEALREAHAERSPMTTGRRIVGGVGVVGAVACAIASAAGSGGSTVSFAVVAVMAAVVGFTALGPVYLPRLLRAVVPGAGPVAQLFRAEATHGARRVSSVMAPILVLAGFAVLLTGIVDTMDTAFDGAASAAIPSELVVSPADGSPAMPSDTREKVWSAGETDVVAPVATTVILHDRALDAWGISGEELSSMGLTVREGSPELLDGGSVVLDADAAIRLGLGAGATVETTFPDGTSAPLDVVAVVSGGPAFSYVDHGTALAHDRTAMTPILYVDGTDQQALSEAMMGTAVQVETPARFESAGNAEEERLLRLFELALVGMSLTFAALAVVNTTSMAAADRRSALALLQRIGATRRQVYGLVALEAFVVATVGVVLGVLLAWPALAGVAAGLSDDVSRAVSPSVRWSAVGTVAVVSVGIVSAAAVVPTTRALRSSVG
ncbi:putative ABC transport system permease protein [Rhodococcus rhodochrous J45]|uniref:Putative ABC transport system permease protein n=1 Tax=Rhodococcus rhodochrous J45 TaxID=935266 RepID=A0A562ETZ6_RHORH|nr:ABC transporter permease [Rhodococcus rhodochrous]TWH25101.1 putative ABC transport system permease protein [Rhodococcus rhodochrous J45]